MTEKGTEIKIDIGLVIGALEAAVAFTKNEFSGVGFGKWSPDGKTFVVYRIEILDVGTHGWTEIRPEDMKHLLTDPDIKNMKLWFHRHPMGRTEPGPSNWSGTDHNTCRNEPLGAAFPPDRGWTCSIVRTPTGWTGRVDEYGQGKGTTYVDVIPNPYFDMLEGLRALEARGKQRYSGVRSEFGVQRTTSKPYYMTENEWRTNQSSPIQLPLEDWNDDNWLEEPVFEDADQVDEIFSNEPDDGPMHMWVESYIENRGL